MISLGVAPGFLITRLFAETLGLSSTWTSPGTLTNAAGKTLTLTGSTINAVGARAKVRSIADYVLSIQAP